MEKNTYTNKVCHTLPLGGSWNLVTLTSRVGECGGGVREEKNKKNIFWGVVLLGRYSLGRGCPLAIHSNWKCKTFHSPWWDSYSYVQSYLVILLPIILISFLFSENKSKRTTSNLKYLKWQKVERGHFIFIFRREFLYEGN